MAGKLIIFSAPSGSGKSTIINHLLKQNLNLHFSISATSRAPRGTEQNGVEYYFLTPSIAHLRERLEGRGTDAPEVIDSRIAKAEFELGFIPHFDVCIVNDDLATAQAEAVEVIKDFLSKE